MKLTLVQKIIVVGVIFSIISILLPNLNIGKQDAILAAVTFIYSVLYGFEISIVLANYSQLKVFVATLNAQLFDIAKFSQHFGKQGDKIVEAVEAYLMRSIDVPLEFHQQTDDDFSKVFEAAGNSTLDAKTDSLGQSLQFLYQGLYDVSVTRNEMEQVAPRFIGKAEWFLLSVLAVVLIAVLFAARGDDLFSELSAAVLATSVVGSLMLLNDIDGNDLQEEFLEYRVFNETLNMIGKESYYPEFALHQGVVRPAKGKKYRIGKFQNYPALTPRKIFEAHG